MHPLNQLCERADRERQINSPASNSNATTVNAVERDLSAFLLGLPSANANSLIEQAAAYDVGENYHGFFVQDDWRVSQRLTLNPGLRYELESGVTEANGQIVTGFDTTTTSPLRDRVLANIAANAPANVPLTAFQNLRGGLQFATNSGDVNQATDKNDFQPRVGIAYALDGKTVIRGAFGIFTSPFQIQAVNQSGFTSTTSFAPTTNNGLTFLADLNNPFPNGVNPAVGSSLGLNTLLGTTIGTTNASGPTETTVFNFNRRNANYTRIIAGTRREIPFGTALEATFVYSKGTDLPVLRQLNYIAAPMRFAADEPSGCVFVRAKLTAENINKGVFLGRPWRDYGRTVFLETEMGAHIKPEGWHHRQPEREKTAYFAEYNSTGAGAKPETRIKWARQLTDDEAKTFRPENFLKGTDN